MVSESQALVPGVMLQWQWWAQHMKRAREGGGIEGKQGKRNEMLANPQALSPRYFLQAAQYGKFETRPAFHFLSFSSPLFPFYLSISFFCPFPLDSLWFQVLTVSFENPDTIGQTHYSKTVSNYSKANANSAVGHCPCWSHHYITTNNGANGNRL